VLTACVPCLSPFAFKSDGYSLKTNFIAKMERKIKYLELKKSGKYCFYLCASIRKYGDVWDPKNAL
jgi:hypothetical protein